ncbi:MAG: aminopeptidase [Bacteroidetes bacterium]|nr:aminopeptidase [Bacteroidota bacterium]
MRIALFVIVGISSLLVNAQDTLTNRPGSNYKFKPVYNVNATEVKDQCRTGTCWSFSSLSFLESELIRKGKGYHNLSEMYIVRCAYIERAITYIRMNGKHQFDQGGESHDIPYIVRKYGIVPDEVYRGLEYGETRHNHDEMVSMLQGMLEKLKNNPQGSYTTAWINAVAGVVDAYLGKVPEKFTYQGKEYTPMSFAQSLELNMDDYVILTSFTHQPMHKPFVIEVADNWSMQTAYNVELNELTNTMENSLKQGYSIAWAADVSEKGFSFMDGLGIVPENDTMVKQKSRDNKYFNDAGGARAGYGFSHPVAEKSITPKIRQDAFDKQTTTDDHGMHITGMVTDQNGKKYYTTKNSWGSENYLKGYLYISQNYVEFKTISIMVHKDSLEKSLKKKLHIE